MRIGGHAGLTNAFALVKTLLDIVIIGCFLFLKTFNNLFV
jgi:hypothetical protein